MKCTILPMELTDTHCHIHDAAAYELSDNNATRMRWLKAGKPDPDEIIQEALGAGVTRLVCVGTDLEDSQRAVEFVQNRASCWVAIGIHPHEALKFVNDFKAQNKFTELANRPKVIAIGECGLDYFYNHSPKDDQIAVLKWQLDLATKHSLPVIFHVRDAFEDFWPILDQYPSLRGVVHSFSSTPKDLERILERNLFVGLNGIMTFTTHPEQLNSAKALPLQKLLLETDAPFLTPKPFRGTICRPKHVRVTAEFLSNLRGETFESLAAATTQNARDLFGF